MGLILMPTVSFFDSVDQAPADAKLFGKFHGCKAGFSNLLRLIECQFSCLPSASVLYWSHRFQMLWINATSLKTKMIKLHSSGDGANFLSIHRDMKIGLLSVNTNQTISSIPLLAVGNPAKSVISKIFNFVIILSNKKTRIPGARFLHASFYIGCSPWITPEPTKEG